MFAVHTDQLVCAIQSGQNELIETVWEQIRGLIAWYARRYYTVLSSAGHAPGGVEVDDLIQSGYFALVDAVKDYDPSRGPFTCLLKYYLKKAFRSTTGRKSDMLDRCLSLDIPVSEDPDGPTRLDFVADARDRFGPIEDAIFQEELHSALETAINAIPSKEAGVIRALFWKGQTLTQTAEQMGVSPERVRQLQNTGLRHMRYGPSRSALEQYVDALTDFYHKSGASHFNQAKSSVVEELVLYRERLRERLSRYDK